MSLHVIFGLSVALLGASAPKGLTELENKIDEIVNTAQWLPNKKER